MAEILGITASIVSLVQLAGQVTSIGYGYIGGVKRASKDLQELSKELSSLSLVLISLQKYSDANPQSTTLQTLNGQDGPLQECASELIILQKKMEPKDGFQGFIGSLKWPLKEAETLQHISRIERQKQLFIFALTADHLSLSKEIEIYVHKTNLVVQEIQTTSAALNSWTQKEDTLRVDQHRKHVLNWLFHGDFDRKHLEIHNKRQKNTGAWLLKEPIFRGWVKRQPDTWLLWGYGIPGAGKTFLSSVVVDHLEAQASTEKLGVAYIYFNYKEKDQQGPVSVLASLVKQLACRLPHLPSEIGRLYDKLASKEKKPTLDDLYTILLAISKSFVQAFIVADALDECDQEDQRRELLPLFHRIGKNGVNLFLTSRQHPEDIQESFRNIAKIELSAKEEDIRLYVQQKIDESPRARRLVRQAQLQDRIISDLVNCANGMFLLVRFHIEYICQQTSSKQILNALSSLKRVSKKNPLDPTYDRIMDNIREQPDSCTELALEILSWLVRTRRVLTVDEIQAAVSVEPGIYELDELDFPDRATMLDVCAGLVTIDESNNIRLVHYTVQEYLLKNSIIPVDADFKIALTCITYLSFDAFVEPCAHQRTFDARFRLYPFLDYISRYLCSHLKDCDEDLMTESVFKLLQSPGLMKSYLQALNQRDTSGIEVLTYYGLYDKTAAPLHTAAHFGHCAVFQRLLDDGADIWTLDSLHHTVLHYAAMGGNERMARLILDKGIPVSTMNKCGRTPLAVAAEWGNEEVARILLDNGADVSAMDWCGWTVTGLAASEGCDAVMRLLLDKGADFSIPDGDGYTPLHWATSKGHEGVFEIVIQNMRAADLSIECKSGRTALDLAFINNHNMMALKIVEKGIDLSIRSGFRYTSLHMAAARGCGKIVELMIERGVDITVINMEGETALDIAMSRGHEEVVAIIKTALERKEKSDGSVQVTEGHVSAHEC